MPYIQEIIQAEHAAEEDVHAAEEAASLARTQAEQNVRSARDALVAELEAARAEQLARTHAELEKERFTAVQQAQESVATFRARTHANRDKAISYILERVKSLHTE